MKYLIALTLLVGCAPATLDDLRCQGEAETRKLVLELRAIETKEELQKAIPRLKKRFVKLADLLIDARAFPNEGALEPTAISEELFLELARLYEMPGGRELIESSQREAVRQLNGRR